MNFFFKKKRWHIKARVTQKSPIRKWHNARGDGQLFSVNLLDQSGEIKATAFNDQVDRLYNMLEEGRVYYISKARVTMAKKQFSTLNNEYELSLDPSTEFEAVSTLYFALLISVFMDDIV
jgi:replication factor A1